MDFDNSLLGCLEMLLWCYVGLCFVGIVLQKWGLQQMLHDFCDSCAATAGFGLTTAALLLQFLGSCWAVVCYELCAADYARLGYYLSLQLASRLVG